MAMYRVTTPEGESAIVEASGCDQAATPWTHWTWFAGREMVVRHHNGKRLVVPVTRYKERKDESRIYIVEYMPPVTRKGITPDYKVLVQNNVPHPPYPKRFVKAEIMYHI